MEKLNVAYLPVLDDFDLFLTFLKSRKETSVTHEQAQLKRTDLFSLNEELHFKAGWVTDKSMQYAYPLLDFFYHVVLAGKLARVHFGEKGNYLKINPDQMERYSLLTRTEQYFFLLETAWRYVNWAKLCGHRSFYFTDDIVNLLRIMSESAPGQEFDVLQERIIIPGGKESIHIGLNNKVIQIFWFLDFYDLEADTSLKKKPDRYTFPFKKFIVREISPILASVLLEQRPFNQWNLPSRKDIDLWGILPGASEEDFTEEEDAESHSTEELATFSFLEPFKPLVEPGELTESFYASEPVFIGGRYLLKVPLSKKIYRIIALSASATLDDLHAAIQEAFHFANDHLYAFFMDGEPWSDDGFFDPRGQDGPFAGEVKLGELDLYPGHRFLYIFDFGDSWQFGVHVLEINPAAPEPQTSEVVEEHGAAPEQYGDGDDW